MNNTTGSKQVLIIGGGIGGLAAAAFLQKLPFRVTVAERAREWREVGAGLVLGPNALAMLNELELVPVLRDRGMPLRRTTVTDAQGRELSAVDAEAVERTLGLPTIAIHRAALHETLLGAIDRNRVVVRSGYTVTNLQVEGEEVAVRFGTGETQRYDLVIGADGIRSRTRAALFGEVAPRYSGYVCWRFVVRSVRLSQPDVAVVMWGRGKRFGIVPIGREQAYCFATMNAPGGSEVMRRIDRSRFASLYAEFGGDAPHMLRAPRPDIPLLLDDTGDLPETAWSHGPVALLGDAAHAITPNMAQGAAMAIEDAMVLAGVLGRSAGIGEALAGYRNARDARVRRMGAWSYRIGRLSQIESPPVVFVRNLVMRLTPNWLAERSTERLVMDFPDPAAYGVQKKNLREV